MNRVPKSEVPSNADPLRPIIDSPLIAIHEASHAVAALAGGLPLDRVVMVPDYRGGPGAAGATSVTDPWWQHREEYALVTLAGKVGSEIYLRRPCSTYEVGAGYDYSQYMWTDGAFRDMAADERSVRLLLEAHWSAVLAIAGVLLTSPVLPAVEFVTPGEAGFDGCRWAGLERGRLLKGDAAQLLFERCGYEFKAKPAPRPRQPVIIVDDFLVVPYEWVVGGVK